MDSIQQTFDDYDISFCRKSLVKAGFGFHKITESFGVKVFIEEEVMKDLKHLSRLQKEALKEQPFALLGFYTVVDGETIFFINHYLKGDNTDSTVRSTSFTENFTNQVNNYINSRQVHNQLVLIGHTHPDMNDVIKNKDVNYQENEVQKAIFDKDRMDSSFLLRKTGLNISVADISHLIHFSNDINGKSDVLIGTAILLPHMELNILFYINNTIQFCNEVFSFSESEIRPIDNFLTSSNSSQF